MSRFIYWCAGVDRQHLGDLSIERSWYQSIGLSVVLTALASSISMTFALTLSLGGSWWKYILFSTFWAIFVFNVDRWLVSTVHYGPLDETNTGREPRTFGRFLGYFARFAFAAVLAVVISEPIVLQIFHREIDQQVAAAKTAAEAQAQAEVMAQPDFATERSRIKDSVDKADSDVTADTAVLKSANDALDAETNGTGGTHRKGCGQRCEERRQDVANAAAQLRTAEATQASVTAQAAIDNKTLADKVNAAIAQRISKIDGGDGLLARETALTQLMKDNPGLSLRRWFVSLLFLLIDLIPLLLKTFGPATMHDRAVRFAAVSRALSHNLARHIADTAIVDKVRQLHLELSVELAMLRARSAYAVDSASHNNSQELAMRRLALQHERNLADLEHYRYTTVAPSAAFAAEPPPDASPESHPESGSATQTTPPTTPRRGSQPEPTSSEQVVVGGRWLLGPPLLSAERGGFGDPYNAVDLHNHRRPAVLKRIRSMPFSDRKSVERAMRYLRREQKQQARIDSPFVAPVLDAGNDPQFGPYLATPLYRQGTVHRLIHDDSFRATLEWALRIAGQILAGLIDCIEQENLVHCDIKPSNVALSDEGEVRLIDFGLARSLEHAGVTTSLTPVFSRWYAPPEQITRTKNWQHSEVDVRAVGATLYEILTGRPPMYREALALDLVDGDELKNVSLIRLICDPSVRPVRADVLVPQLPGYVADLVDQWLLHDPELRAPGDLEFAVHNAAEALRLVSKQVEFDGLDGIGVGPHHVNEDFASEAGVGLPRQRREPGATHMGPTSETQSEVPVSGGYGTADDDRTVD